MCFGIYIHFPWCHSRCPYCDFAIAVPAKGKEPPHEAYLEAVLAELEQQGPRFLGKELVSIYFGGGTPSLWEPDCIASMIEACCRRFEARPGDLEICIECNPGHCTRATFAAWQSARVNRVLVGVQATNEHDLMSLGRDHRVGDGLSGLSRTLDAGFQSVGADVILGIPGGGVTLSSLAEVADLEPPHISAYELTIEDRTTFGRRVRNGELVPEDEDTLAEIYECCHDELCSRGYEHYEVSSFAKPGHRAVHNSLYWQGADYLGLGNGAASLLCSEDGSAVRWQNRRSVKRYLAADATAHSVTRDPINSEEFAVEKLWLAMRTANGAAQEAFHGLESVLQELLDSGLLKHQAGRISPTLKGFLYNNQLISRLGLASR
ncbi:MAG: radical SAM family heme chaperone HemW [Myxococcales bacterium]|nr:radical SAM family heme chaperone HemW [Myxococcales bacterium]